MWESLRPGMTVRAFPSITSVPGPRSRRISSFVPVAAIFPSVMARASTNDGTVFVAILALCSMVSADIESPSVVKCVRKGQGRPCPSGSLFVGGDGGGGDRIFGKLCGRKPVDHCVGVLHTYAVGSAMGPHNVHNCVVGLAVCPIALPLEHHRESRDRLRACLDDAPHRVIVVKLAYVATAVFDDVDFVAIVNRLNGRERNTGLGPEPGQHNFLPP